MISKFKTVISLIRQRFDILEADLKTIKVSQQNINRRLDVIEAKLAHRQDLLSRTDHQSND